jgi:hypothetical protein
MNKITKFENFSYPDVDNDFQISSRPRKYTGTFNKWADFESKRVKIEATLREILKASLGEEFVDWILIYLHDLNSFSIITPPVEDTRENELLQRKIVGILSENTTFGKVTAGPVTHEGFRIVYF